VGLAAVRVPGRLCGTCISRRSRREVISTPQHAWGLAAAQTSMICGLESGHDQSRPSSVASLAASSTVVVSAELTTCPNKLPMRPNMDFFFATDGGGTSSGSMVSLMQSAGFK
jgi:hypothetical protein